MYDCINRLTLLISIALLCFTPIIIDAQSSVNKDYPYIYLVRHAEKADDGTKDPPLNDTGMARSEKLSQLLVRSDIRQIHSTDYKRTRNTAQPLASLLGQTIQIYDPLNDAIIQKIKNSLGNMLIVGHSNTIPVMVNALLGREQFEQLDEMEYDKLFIMCRVDGVYGVALLKF